MNTEKITKEQYEAAKAARDAADAVMQQYHRQLRDNSDDRWKEFLSGNRPYTLDEIRFSAGARCDVCGAGLAYPKDCGIRGAWHCSAYLLGTSKDRHPEYPFAFYSIISEDQKARAQGQTTRPSPEGGAK